jgi:hypothetical protein
MGINDGYQILEPNSLSGLIANPSQAALALALMDWLSIQFASAFPLLSNKVTLDVIPVTYQGTYPAFGVKYKSEDSEDLSKDIEAAIESLIEKSSVSQMLLYFADSTVDWCEAWQTLKEKFNGIS